MRLEIAPCYNFVNSELTHFSLNIDLKDYDVYNFNYELTLTGSSVFLLLITTSSISKHSIQSATELCHTFPFVLLQKCLGCDLQYKTTATTERNMQTAQPHNLFLILMAEIILFCPIFFTITLSCEALLHPVTQQHSLQF